MTDIDLRNYTPFIHLVRKIKKDSSGNKITVKWELTIVVAFPKKSYEGTIFPEGEGREGVVRNKKREITFILDGDETASKRYFIEKITLSPIEVDRSLEDQIKVIFKKPIGPGGNNSTTVNYEDADDEE